MASVLLTAFEPYDRWQANASWLALVELTKDLPLQPELTTRLYPVDYAAVAERLACDLAEDFDYVLHLGQAPNTTCIQLESIGLNVTGRSGDSTSPYGVLVDDGPVAYRSRLPLNDWAARLCQEGIPTQVSFHAGTFLCNAALYYSLHFAESQKLKTQSTFIHLPLDTTQACVEENAVASMSSTMAAAAIRLILGELEESALA